jgi:anti-anti-sigma factor
MPVSTDVIEVGSDDTTLLVRVRGRGMFLNCQPLKQYAGGLIARGCRIVLVDAAHCTYMDSSFLGMLAGLAISLRKTGGSVTVAGPQAKVAETLRTIGLNHVFKIITLVKEPPGLATEPLSAAHLDKLELAEEMLAAHEHLIEVDGQNEERFKSVHEELRKELGKDLRGK